MAKAVDSLDNLLDILRAREVDIEAELQSIRDQLTALQQLRAETAKMPPAASDILGDLLKKAEI